MNNNTRPHTIQDLWNAIRDDKPITDVTLIGRSVSVRDAVVLAAIDPAIDEDQFDLIATRPHSTEAVTLMRERLTRSFQHDGIPDPARTRRIADRLADTGRESAPSLAAAAYLHWACGDAREAQRLGYLALNVDCRCTLAAITATAVQHGIVWARTAQ